MESELENTINGSLSKNALKKHKKSGFGNWTTKIGPIENKLKDKNYRGHGKSCPRIENHSNGTSHFPWPL
jgi:hypothetical protein